MTGRIETAVSSAEKVRVGYSMDQTHKGVAHSAQDHPPLLAIIDLNMGCPGQPMLHECILAGQEAWRRLSSGHTRQDWLLVGKALQLLRVEAMLTAHVNKPEGRRYSQEYSDLLRANGFDAVDKSTRSRLLSVLENIAEIEKWLATVPANKQLELNHPHTIWRAYQRIVAKKPGDTTAKKPSHVEKLKQAIVDLEEHATRLASEAPFTPRDKPRDQAAVVWRLLQCSPSAARALCRELYKLARVAEAEDQTTAEVRA